MASNNLRKLKSHARTEEVRQSERDRRRKRLQDRNNHRPMRKGQQA